MSRKVTRQACFDLLLLQSSLFVTTIPIMTPIDYLRQAVLLLGGVTPLASAIGVRRTTIYGWLTRGRVPSQYCAVIEKATKKKIRRAHLRPDVFVS
jgi:hypothetical protein